MLLGHGTVTASTQSCQGSVMAVASIEHQARLNYMAMCAGGFDHPSIPLELASAVGQAFAKGPPPHLAERMAQIPGGRSGAGIWSYYEELVTGDM
jgi:hypothetical protein